MTDADRVALDACRELFERHHHDHTFTCTELGERLWGSRHRNRQSYARPAGRVLARLKAQGYVLETHRRLCGGRSKCAWTLTTKEPPKP